MTRFLRRDCTALFLGIFAIGCSSSDRSREAAADSPRAAATDTTASGAARADGASAWYNSSRAIDLTGDGQPDTVRLVASGARTDSLQITLSMLVGGEEKHRESWGSSYELDLLDSTMRTGPRAEGILRAKLDSVLASVVVEPLSAPGVRVMAEDSATLAGLDPRPTHRVSFSYGYESTSRLVWDAPRARFVRLWSCC
jgi:hypothetical protein